MPLPEFAIIIPACDEAACIGAVLDELLATVDPEKYVIAVGVNGSSDATAQIARQRLVLVAETALRGYGHGCQAAIDLTNDLFPVIRAYVFCAGDGATDPRDLRALRTAFEQGYDLVLGSRTKRLRNWPTMTLRYLVANAALRHADWSAVIARYAARRLGEPSEALAPQLVAHIALGASSAAYSEWLRDENSDLVDLITRAFAMVQFEPEGPPAPRAAARRRARKVSTARP